MISICRFDQFGQHTQLASVADFNDAVAVAATLAKRYRCKMLIVRGIEIIKEVNE